MKRYFHIILISLLSTHLSIAQDCLGIPGEGPVFFVVEDMPRFPGCEHIPDIAERKLCAEQKLLEFVYSNLYYPQAAFDSSIEGVVVIQFIVEKTGCLSEIEIITNLGGGTGEEAKRIIELINKQDCKWEPGFQQGDTVRVRFNLPIQFKITDTTQVAGDSLIEHTCEPMFLGNEELNSTISNLEIFPNPTKDFLTISLNSTRRFHCNYHFLDLHGRVLETGEKLIETGENYLNFAISDMMDGIKIIAISDEKNRFLVRRKFVVSEN